jgi:hypothetical protein
MFANLVQLVSHRLSANYDLAFVKEVTVTDKPVRDPRLEKFVLIGWLLIAVKNFAVVWAIGRWHIPFDPLWLNGPTVAMGILVTIVVFFFWRE